MSVLILSYAVVSRQATPVICQISPNSSIRVSTSTFTVPIVPLTSVTQQYSTFFNLMLLYQDQPHPLSVSSHLIDPSQSATSIFTVSVFPSRPASPVDCQFLPYRSITASHTHIHSTCISIKICHIHGTHPILLFHQDKPHLSSVSSYLMCKSIPAVNISPWENAGHWKKFVELLLLAIAPPPIPTMTVKCLAPSPSDQYLKLLVVTFLMNITVSAL